MRKYFRYDVLTLYFDYQQDMFALKPINLNKNNNKLAIKSFLQYIILQPQDPENKFTKTPKLQPRDLL